MIDRRRSSEDAMYHLISEKPAESVLPTRSIKRWVIATFCLIVISLIEGCIIVKLATKDSSRGFETGFTTEFPDSKDAITIEKVRFTSPLKVDENGTLHQVNNSNERRYMGDSLEVDQAWEDLIYGRYIRLREPEVDWLDSDKGNENLKEIPAHDPVIAKSGMFGGVDMLYSLHCLNMLRKSLHGKHMKMEVFSEEENNIYPGKSCPS